MTTSRPSAVAAFEAAFGVAPTYLSRAPGRVNLIGEHTDYNDLPVVPMALQRQTRIALRPRDDGMVGLRNGDPAFPAVAFEIGAENARRGGRPASVRHLLEAFLRAKRPR